MVAVLPAASVSVTTMFEKLAAAVAVPEIAPVFGSMVNPAGRLVALQLNGLVPAVLAMFCVYCTFFLAFGNETVVMFGAELIVSEKVRVAVRGSASVKGTTIDEVPALVGVPFNTPALDRLMPAGTPVAVKV